ncbi:MAG: ABC transporter ATP-binding protein [Eubacterium sp.]|nr:ABC transporter ATP-binding protein [Eubacterium sp.]
MKNILKLDHLEKEYGQKENKVVALKSINLEVDKGEFVAIVGTSGSGKSTLLNLIGGLDTPTKGQIFVRDEEISLLRNRELTKYRRDSIGFVFQNYSLMPVLSVYDNVALPLSLSGKKVDHGYIKELLTELGIWDKRRKYPSELSGGQMQKVAIARALVNKPAILLADEPTGNLDSNTTSEVMDMLRESNRKFNQTILMVTHNDALAKVCDRVIRIEDGQVQTEVRVC